MIRLNRPLCLAAALPLLLPLAGCGWNDGPSITIDGQVYRVSNADWQDGPPLDGSGVIVPDRREVQVFNEVRLVGPFEVVIDAQPGDPLVTVHCDENISGLIETAVHRGRLDIQPVGSFRTGTMPRIEVRGDAVTLVRVDGSGSIDVRSIATDSFSTQVNGSGDITLLGSASTMHFGVAGSGDIEAAGVAADSMTIEIAGSGSVTVAGTTTQLSIGIAGSGDVHGRNLEAGLADVSISGSGDVVIRVRDTLDASISGSGEVLYVGEPDVNVHINGSGGVHPAQ
ncbi:MAG: DUF2807 domain-containing protein [Phycisphaerales bacterium]|nr:DUF2807 domain-containing protein [Phycisphaerales bacterium]